MRFSSSPSSWRSLALKQSPSRSRKTSRLAVAHCSTSTSFSSNFSSDFFGRIAVSEVRHSCFRRSSYILLMLTRLCLQEHPCSPTLTHIDNHLTPYDTSLTCVRHTIRFLVFDSNSIQIFHALPTAPQNPGGPWNPSVMQYALICLDTTVYQSTYMLT